MKYISFVWWIAKYCDFLYFFLFVICVCLHPHINTPAVNCEERSKLSTGGYQLTGRVHGLSKRSISEGHAHGNHDRPDCDVTMQIETCEWV